MKYETYVLAHVRWIRQPELLTIWATVHIKSGCEMDMLYYTWTSATNRIPVASNQEYLDILGYVQVLYIFLISIDQRSSNESQYTNNPTEADRAVFHYGKSSIMFSPIRHIKMSMSISTTTSIGDSVRNQEACLE